LTKYLRVKNWTDFQHYKDRNPPWIKLHRDLLRDYDFICLQDASKMQLMLIWLLASQLDNKIPADADYIKAQIGVSQDIDLKELIDKGFLVDDSNTLAECKQVAIVETETYNQEAEKETETDLMCNYPDPDIMFNQFWDLYDKKVNSGKVKKKFFTLINKEIVDFQNLMIAVNSYVISKPDKQFRKDPMTYLNNESWNDEIILPSFAKPTTTDYVTQALERVDNGTF